MVALPDGGWRAGGVCPHREGASKPPPGILQSIDSRRMRVSCRKPPKLWQRFDERLVAPGHLLHVDVRGDLPRGSGGGHVNIKGTQSPNPNCREIRLIQRPVIAALRQQGPGQPAWWSRRRLTGAQPAAASLNRKAGRRRRHQRVGPETGTLAGPVAIATTAVPRRGLCTVTAATTRRAGSTAYSSILYIVILS